MKIQELQSRIRATVNENLKVGEVSPSEVIAMLTVLQFEILTAVLEASKPKIMPANSIPLR